MMNIGIDLGMTYSAVAVKGRVELAQGYTGAEYLEQVDATIPPTESGNLKTPSVMWWHPDQPDQYIFGDEAKQMFSEGKSPIWFFMRSIGTSEQLMLNGRAFTAKEVAALFLRHLQETAERVTGQKVGRAIITHPAYFTPGCREEILAAAREKIEGVTQVKRFDGDHLLGGYTFDRAFIQWVLDQLKAQGRNIPYDENNEEHRGRRARMWLLAESVKIRLPEQRTPKIGVPVKIDFLVDDQGQRVQFEGRINREQYAALIQEELRKTTDCCWRALEKAGGGIQVTTDENGLKRVKGLDAILFVGGSTSGQWVTDAVRREFGELGEPYFPDLMVAAGAVPAHCDEFYPGGHVILHLDFPAKTISSTVTITGAVKPAEWSDLTLERCRSLQVFLEGPDGCRVGPAEIGCDGQFAFEGVALCDDGAPSTFTVTVIRDGQVLLAQQGTVKRFQDDSRRLCLAAMASQQMGRSAFIGKQSSRKLTIGGDNRGILQPRRLRAVSPVDADGRLIDTALIMKKLSASQTHIGVAGVAHR